MPRLLLAVLTLAVAGTGACTKNSDRARSEPAHSPPTARDATLPVADQPAASRPKAPTPYPEDWIREQLGRGHNALCGHLVYKDECRAVRSGRITMKITLDTEGGVTEMVQLDTTVQHDPDLVEECLRSEVSKRSFHPPENHLPSFVFVFRLSDRC